MSEHIEHDNLGRPVLDQNLIRVAQQRQSERASMRSAETAAQRAAALPPPSPSREDVARQIEAKLRKEGPGAVAAALNAQNGEQQ